MSGGDENETIDALSKRARRCTDPLFFHDHFLTSGHDDKTRNATGTFIKYGGRYYICSCRHVMDATNGPAAFGPETRNPSVALMIGKVVINLSYFTVDGLQSSLSAPEAIDGYVADICIVPIDNQWTFIRGQKDKEAIDLDTWIEPHWSDIKMCAVAGYADEHKAVQGDHVASPMPLIVVDPASSICPDAREFSLFSTLLEPHGCYFSGISGGPIFGLWGDDQHAPIGIVFEGYPSSRSAPDSIFAGPKDIFVRGLLLTPSIFDGWVKAMGVNAVQAR